MADAMPNGFRAFTASVKALQNNSAQFLPRLLTTRKPVVFVSRRAWEVEPTARNAKRGQLSALCASATLRPAVERALLAMMRDVRWRQQVQTHAPWLCTSWCGEVQAESHTTTVTPEGAITTLTLGCSPDGAFSNARYSLVVEVRCVPGVKECTLLVRTSKDK